MWTSVARWPRTLALAAVVVLTVVPAASAGWLWEPRIQVTDTGLPDYGAIPEFAQPGRTADVAMHLIVRVWDNPENANTWGRGYYVRLHPDSTWASAWARRELFTNIEEGLGGGHRSSTDHHIVEDRDGDIHLVSEVTPHPLATPASGLYIGYKRRGGPHWSADSLSFLVSTAAGGGPSLFLQTAVADTLHAIWGVPGEGSKYYSRKAVGADDGLWDARSRVAGPGAGISDLVVDDTGLVHFFGRRLGDTTRVVDLHGPYPGPGQDWVLSESVIHEWTPALLEPDLGLDESDVALLPGPYLYYSFVAPDSATGIVEVFLSRLDLSVTPFDWEDPVQVSPDDGVQSRGVTLFVDGGSGTFHVMYQEPRGGPNEVGQAWAPDDTTRIYHTFSRSPMSPGSWSTPTEVVPERRTTSGRPVYVARGDTVRVAWISADDDFPVAGSDDDYEVWVRTGHAIADTLESADVTWSGAVYLDGDFEVQAGKTLTIEPGTRIFAEAGAGSEKVDLIVSGRLIAVGTANDPITFAPYDGAGAPGEWGGIVFPAGSSAATSSIEHVTIEGAVIGMRISSAEAPALGDLEFSASGVADIYLARDVTIAAGSVWDLSGPVRVAGAYFPEADDAAGHADVCDLIVNGALRLVGDAVDSAELTGEAGGAWGGITFTAGADAAASAIENAAIRDAVDGVRIGSATAPTLQHIAYSGSVASDILLMRDVRIPEGTEWLLDGPTRVVAVEPPAGDDELGTTGKTDLIVLGSLVTQATPPDSVWFESVAKDSVSGDDWAGITIAAGGVGILNGCDVGYGLRGVYFADASTAVLENSRVHNYEPAPDPVVVGRRRVQPDGRCCLVGSGRTGALHNPLGGLRRARAARAPDRRGTGVGGVP